MSKKRKGEYLIKEFNNKVEKDHFTLVYCFSRPWCVAPIFRSLNAMAIPMKQCHLLIYDNSDNALLERALRQKLKMYEGKFASLRYYKSYRRGGSVIRTMRKYEFKVTKLPPIQDMYKELTKHIKTELFINIEDDTFCPSITVMELLTKYDELKNKLGKDLFLSGIETSRHYDKSIIPILAVYWIEEKDGMIIKKTSAKCNRYTTIPVHACGHYCFITTKKIWDLGWKYSKKKIDHIKHFAMDVFHTYHLHKLGVPIYADFKVRCSHMHAAPGKLIYWKACDSVPMLDYYIEKYNVWGKCIPLPNEVQLKD